MTFDLALCGAFSRAEERQVCDTAAAVCDVSTFSVAATDFLLRAASAAERRPHTEAAEKVFITAASGFTSHAR